MKKTLMNDTTLGDAVRTELQWDPKVDPAHIGVSAVDGAVTREWSFQREQAERAIRHLAGVRTVDNEIALKPQAKPEAAEVERRVEDAIERMADLDAGSVRVTTRDGTIRLHGQVHSLAERRTAQRAAESAPGVMRVENDLVVRP